METVVKGSGERKVEVHWRQSFTYMKRVNSRDLLGVLYPQQTSGLPYVFEGKSHTSIKGHKEASDGCVPFLQ